MPEQDDEQFDFEEINAEESPDIFNTIIYWAPAAFFGLSIVFVILTIALNPLSRRVQRKEAIEYYQPAINALQDLSENSGIYSDNEKIKRLNVARVNLQRLIRHYRRSNEFQNGKYLNPYLLMAEANNMLAELSVPIRRESLLSESNSNYLMAFDLEEKDRSEQMQEVWDDQFFYPEKDLNIPREEVVKVRKARRKRYLIYNVGVVNIKLNRPTTASRYFKQLKQEFFEEEMERLRLERAGLERTFINNRILPANYELLGEDKVKLHYYLALVSDMNKNYEEAEREYRVFLLKVGRSRERFLSKMRLGEFSFKRGKDYIDEADKVAGTSKIDLKNKALFEFRTSADIYSDVIEESAPEDILRKAYFYGGIANLEYAAAMDVRRETSWDYLGREVEDFKSYMEDFSGMKLPERALSLPEALASSILSDSLSIPGLTSDVPSLVLGSSFSVITRKRTTPIEERDMRLSKARSYFDAASSGPKGKFLAESRVLIGRSLMVEERPDEARRILKHAMQAYPLPHIKVASLLGIGWTYLTENELDDAWKNFQALPTKSDLPKSTLYSVDDIHKNIAELGRMYVSRADSLVFPENWLDAPAGSEKMSNAIRNSKELQRSLLQAGMVYELLINKYESDDIAVKINAAAIYARLAGLLEKRPFGSVTDIRKARNYRMNAADIYMKVSVSHPGSSYDMNSLLRAGELFYESEAYERSCESFELFVSRYSRTDQIGRVRNLLGLAYQKLGLFEKSENVLRVNAQDSTTAEGRKSLYYLGQTYLMWSKYEKDQSHLGGPSSELLLAKRDVETEKISSLIYMRDITDWGALLDKIKEESFSYSATPGKRIKELLPTELSLLINDIDTRDNISEDIKTWFLAEVNKIIARSDFYSEPAWRSFVLSDEIMELLRRDSSDLGVSETMRLNRLLIDVAYPNNIVPAKIRERSDIIPRTAREVFEYVRRQPGMGPSSLPWRWSTFALGETLYLIAENEKAKSIRGTMDKNQKDSFTRTNTSDVLRSHYQRAMDILIEGLNRYVLFPEHPNGLKVEDDPNGYMEIKKSRFKSLYYLGMSYKELGNDKALQRAFSKIIDDDIFEEDVWDDNAYMISLHKNAFFYLGQSYYNTAKYEDAYQVYESANDKLKADTSPYFIYMMGECLFAMDKKRLARSKYIQARHAVRSLVKPKDGAQEDILGISFWQQLNEQRIKDLEYLEKSGNF